MPLSTSMVLNLTAEITKALDLRSAASKLTVAKTIAMVTGTGNNQADLAWDDTRSAAAADPLDLNGGGLTDIVGTAFNLAKLKMIYFAAAAANTQNLNFVRPANGVPWLLASGDAVVVPPGGGFIWWAPVAGVAVTAGTGDLIEPTPVSGTQSYDIGLIGTSA